MAKRKRPAELKKQEQTKKRLKLLNLSLVDLQSILRAVGVEDLNRSPALLRKQIVDLDLDKNSPKLSVKDALALKKVKVGDESLPLAFAGQPTMADGIVCCGHPLGSTKCCVHCGKLRSDKGYCLRS